MTDFRAPHAARPELRRVPPCGLTAGNSADEHRHERTTWHLKGADVPYRAGLHVGIAYSTWGVAPRQVERLTEMAQELTTAAIQAHEAPTGDEPMEPHLNAVTALLDGDQATVNVIAAACVPAIDDAVTGLKDFAHACGHQDLAAADCTCVALALMTAAPAPRRPLGTLPSKA